MRCFQKLSRHFQSKRRQAGDDGRIVISPFTRTTENADGIVWLQIDAGLVFSSNRVGARIWQGLLESKTLVSIAEDIGREYGVAASEVEPDVNGFLADLEEQRLVAREWSIA